MKHSVCFVALTAHELKPPVRTSVWFTGAKLFISANLLRKKKLIAVHRNKTKYHKLLAWWHPWKWFRSWLSFQCNVHKMCYFSLLHCSSLSNVTCSGNIFITWICSRSPLCLDLVCLWFRNHFHVSVYRWHRQKEIFISRFYDRVPIAQAVVRFTGFICVCSARISLSVLQ